MTLRISARPLLAALVLAAACTPEAPVAAPSAAPRLQGGATLDAVSVAGTWEGDRQTSATTTRHWSLVLTQRDSKLEGQLTSTATINGQFYVWTYRVISGSNVNGSTVTVNFERGEGSETKPSYRATLDSAGLTMTGTYTNGYAPITLTRQ